MGGRQAELMNILIFGAGVLGSLYGARLKQAGQEVTILARGERFSQISREGIVLEHALTGKREIVSVPVVDKVDADDRYDLIVVLVRKNQLPSALPSLSATRRTTRILVMVNNASGYDSLIAALGKERVLLGFAGAGGVLKGNVVRYAVVSSLLQATTFSELGGSKSPELMRIMRHFHEAGFPVAFSRNMDAWQKTHVAWVSPVANAIYMVEGDPDKLAGSSEVARLLVRAVREGYEVLRRLEVPITPRKLHVWSLVPETVLVWVIRWWASTEQFKTVIVAHAMNAADEMRQLADEFRLLAEAASMETPAIGKLRSFIPTTRPGGGADGEEAATRP